MSFLAEQEKIRIEEWLKTWSNEELLKKLILKNEDYISKFLHIETYTDRSGDLYIESLNLIEKELINRGYNYQDIQKSILSLKTDGGNNTKKNSNYRSLNFVVFIATVIFGITFIIIFTYAEMAKEASAVGTGIAFVALHYLWRIKPKEK